MNVLVLHSQVPFVQGGAEVLVKGLISALRERGHHADLVALPLAWNPPERLLTTALAWRLLDLSRFNDRVVDCVICTKYPTWAAEHANKRLWLIHQHRQAYDLFGTSLSEFAPSDESRATRERLIEIDSIGIGDCTPRYGISKNVCARLQRYTSLHAEPLYPPVPRKGLVNETYDPFILSAARLDDAKRVESLIRAMPSVNSSVRLVVAGDGPNRRRLEDVAVRLGVSERVTFPGRVDDVDLVRLYNTCRAVYYAPIDEDYGYSAVEALAASKPVITAPDSGGVLEFVTHERTGLVTPLDVEPLADAVNRLALEPVARELGAAGPALVAPLTWDRVIDALISD